MLFLWPIPNLKRQNTGKDKQTDFFPGILKSSKQNSVLNANHQIQ